MAKFAVHYLSAKHEVDGSISVEDSDGSQVRYAHPLECVESELKVRNGRERQDWEIRELRDEHWRAGLAEVFCSANPAEVEERIRECRPQLAARFPKARADGFVWYMADGALVTFYRRPPARRSRRIEILARYFMPFRGADREAVLEFTGTCEEIAARLAIDYPLPEQPHALKESS